MKKGTKIALIIAFTTLAIGIIILVSTGIHIGRQGFRDIYYTTRNVFNEHFFEYDDWDSDIVFPEEAMRFPNNSIKNIEIDLEVAGLYITTGDNIRFEAKNVPGAQIICELENDGTLVIYDKHKENIFNGINNSPTGILTLPNGITLNELEIDCDVGAVKIDVEELETLALDVSVEVGDVEIENIISNNSDISVDVGSIKIDGTLLGYNDMRCAIGQLEISTEGQLADYSYNVSNNLGKININNYSTSGIINRQSSEEKRNHFDLHCELGDIKLEIAN